MAKVTSLILTIEGTNPDIILTKDHKTQSITVGGNTYELSIKELGYQKKMYTPGEITATMQLRITSSTTWVAATKGNLEAFFRNKKVSLKYGDIEKKPTGEWSITNDSTICDGYFIHGVEPRYHISSMFVTLNIFSPDKLLTMEKGCKSWVAEQLGAGIIEGNKEKFKLPYDSTKELAVDYSNLKMLKADGQEEIFPYLVQYNESYYDFLVRTCNRWGEFMYYEDNKLNFGFPQTDSKDITQFDTLTYFDINEDSTAPESTGTIADGVTHDIRILNNPLAKDKYAQTLGVIGCDLDHGGDKWATKVIGSLLSSGKNLYDYLVDTTVDELIAREQADTANDKLNKKFNQKYFNTDGLKDGDKISLQYDKSKSQFNQFSTISPRITSENYKQIVANEIQAAKDAVCINFDTSYQDLKLGDIITIQSKGQKMLGEKKYIVVEASTKNVETLSIDSKNNIVKEIKTTYQIKAICKCKTGFFPTLHPAGHVRLSGPQRAKVVEESMDDPIRQNRVRVQFPWQDTKDETPWLDVTRPGGNKSTGSYNRHYKDEEVIVAFVDNNLERPYVIGSLTTKEQKAPFAAAINDILHVTPGGQAIKMSDGLNSGFSAFMSNISPGWKLVTGFMPGFTLPGLDFDGSNSFEGSIELTDKYGIYSIKGSTDGRNVSIKSPYGDIKLGAFTGITISAPNGDVKIQGKNVTIEAGNNLTLTSGKNVKDGFWLSYNDKDISKMGSWVTTLGATVAKKVAATVGGFIDLSVARHATEIFMRPIEGKLQVKSNRYLTLEAGKGKANYPVDAYIKPGHKDPNLAAAIMRTGGKSSEQAQKDTATTNVFNAIPGIAVAAYNDTKTLYNSCRNRAEGINNIIMDNTTRKDNKDLLPTKTLKEIIDAIWSNPDADNNSIMGYQNMLQDATEQNIKPEQVNFYTANMPNLDNASQKKRAKYAIKRIKAEKTEINLILDAIKGEIKRLKTIKIDSYVDNANLPDNIKNALKAENLYTDAYFKKCMQDEDFKYFRYQPNQIEEKLQAQHKPLRRRMFITAVDTLGFERAAVGGVMGVGAKAPDAPNPFKDNIEADWNTYVNSIQKMPGIPKQDPTKTELLKDVVQGGLDQILKQNGIQPFIKDAQDCYSFSTTKRGEILFTNGGDTMVLGKQISRANTDGAEDTEFQDAGVVHGKVSNIRRIMSEP